MILVMGALREPWQQMERVGIRQTWLAEDIPKVTSLTYFGMKPSRFELIWSWIDERLRFWPVFGGRCPWDYILLRTKRLPTVKRRGPNGLEVAVPEVLARAGEKTLAVLSWSLSNSHFDFLWLSNTSSYVQVEKVLEWCRGREPKGIYAGSTTKYRSFSFVSGTGILLSRDVAEAILSERRHWRHDLLVDVALGQICGRLGLTAQEIPRLDVTCVEDLNSLSTDELREFAHFRCKSISRPMGEIQLMRALHGILRPPS